LLYFLLIGIIDYNLTLVSDCLLLWSFVPPPVS
jgi:hypothetical protein